MLASLDAPSHGVSSESLVSGEDSKRIRLVGSLGGLSTSLSESEEIDVSRDVWEDRRRFASVNVGASLVSEEIDVNVGVSLVSDAHGTMRLHSVQYQPCHDSSHAVQLDVVIRVAASVVFRFLQQIMNLSISS